MVYTNQLDALFLQLSADEQKDVIEFIKKMVLEDSEGTEKKAMLCG